MQKNKVPMEVRNYVDNFIASQTTYVADLQKNLELEESNVSALAQRIQNEEADQESKAAKEKQLLAIRRQVADQRDYLKTIQREIETANLFLTDWRFREVYRLLDGEFDDHDEHIVGLRWSRFVKTFIEMFSLIDFKQFSNALSKANSNTKAIARKAQELASLLADTVSLGFECPCEFTSAADLLRQTDNTLSPLRHEQWQWGRDYLFDGPVPSAKRLRTSREPIEVFQDLRIPQDWEYSPQEAEFRRDFWGAGPSTAGLLQSLANLADQWEPTAEGFVGAALLHRQRNQKNDYLRAVLHELRKQDVPIIPEAVAITASIVIDDDVQTKDVRIINKEIG